MLPLLQLSIFVISILVLPSLSVQSNFSSIYDVLKSHGLPMGLLPKGVSNFSFDDSGKFEVFLDQACNAKFENELHYERNVSGTLRYGQIGGLSGISAQDLFLWFPVKEIRVDIPSSGLIYFDVGVVFKQFSLSSFETPRDCTAVQLTDQIEDGKHMLEAVSKSLEGELQFQLDQGNFARAVL
ncbi:OLC1v1006609C3 [Oldenlandia corymbosa var. corymbosa]|uniref:OLC1v1006609C3 n=1 Tax=Oldenlandia corymbosa var. corymbosa TaxID=529605 RepID=A0AAV1DHY1_OLDCO|nr:OLC1v1006609C3 [Oldenlandia corymbosa var. corymbosa]